MKKKGVLFYSLVFILVIAILIGGFILLFQIKNIEIEFGNELQFTKTEDVESYVNKYLKTNAFSFDKEEFSLDVESKFSYLNINHIEMVFPSKIIVTVDERFPLFAISDQSLFYVFDKKGTLLEERELLEGGLGLDAPILIDGIKFDKNIEISDYFGSVVPFETDKEHFNLAIEFFDILDRLGYDEERTKRFIKSIEIDVDNNISFVDRIGVNCVIYDFESDSEAKLSSLIGAYSSDVGKLPGDTFTVTNDLQINFSPNKE